MQFINSLLRNFDLYSSEVYFTINGGKKRISTVYGGIITILSSIGIVILSILFLIQFFKGSSSSVLTRDESTENLNLPLHQYPFMLRLSTEKVKVYNETERLYTIKLKLKIGGGNHSSQWTEDITMEKCDINKHFGNFSELFKNISDLDTFFCPVMRMNNQSVIGIYGGEQVFQYYHFYITMCINSTENSNCYDDATITKYLKATYLDVLTVDYNLYSNDKGEKPYTLFIRSDRHSLSNTVYKRVWMYMESIDYYKDMGLVFESRKLYSFFKVNSFRYDMDMRDIFNGVTVPGTFANLSILNYSNRKTYYQKYMKAQEFFANVGGITKIINVACLLLNYGFSEGAYKTELITYMFEGVKMKKKKTPHNKTAVGNGRVVTSLSSLQNSKSTKAPSELIGQTKPLKNGSSYYKTSKKESIVKEKHSNANNNQTKPPLFEVILSKIFCTPKYQEIYLNNYSLINNELDIKTYITYKKKINDLLNFFKMTSGLSNFAKINQRDGKLCSEKTTNKPVFGKTGIQNFDAFLASSRKSNIAKNNE